MKNKLKQTGSIFDMEEQSQYTVVAIPRTAMDYTIFINDAIKNGKQVEEVVTALNMANEEDTVLIHLSSPGGCVSTGNQIISAIENCRSHVHVHCSGQVCSMAPFIVLAANSFTCEEYTQFMFHTISFGTFSEGVDVEKYSAFVNKQTRKMFEDRLNGFFTEEEIDGILLRKDEVWMDAEEFVNRANAQQEFLSEEFEDEEELPQAVLQQESCILA